MKKLSTGEWIAVIVAIIILAVFLSPMLGLNGLLGNPGTLEDVTGELDSQINTNTQDGAMAGLGIETVTEGTGEEAVAGKLVVVHYTGTLEDGTKFDSSVDRGTPFEFILGVGQVIPGWDQGVVGMKVGEMRKLTIPSDLAYGPNGVTDPNTGQVVIPGGATLLFDVELLSVEDLPQEPQEVSTQ